ncbi:MAG: DUF2059 domain-containing protein [Erythrobacter sp.]|nr:DUF2059 domain-containing protein [Erythrobacter sp.]
MIMRLLTAAAAGLALLVATPALAAQDSAPIASSEADELAAMTEMFSKMFTAEPLTAEQLIAKVIPEGTMAEMMDKVYNGVMGPMMAAAPDGATATLARQIGLPPYALDLGEDHAAELASLFDPAWAERQQREMAMIPAMMKDVMTLMEPGMRKAMAELYAIRFSDSDLAEIDAFFSTPTGAKYARESFLMASDPRIMAASMDAMPALMGMMGDMEARMAESVAGLPAVRSFADLSPEERARVAEMTGYSVEDIEANLNRDEGDSDFE